MDIFFAKYKKKHENPQALKIPRKKNKKKIMIICTFTKKKKKTESRARKRKRNHMMTSHGPRLPHPSPPRHIHHHKQVSWFDVVIVVIGLLIIHFLWSKSSYSSTLPATFTSSYGNIFGVAAAAAPPSQVTTTCSQAEFDACKGKERGVLIVDHMQWDIWGYLGGTDVISQMKVSSSVSTASNGKCTFILHVRPKYFVQIDPLTWTNDFIVHMVKNLQCGKTKSGELKTIENHQTWSSSHSSRQSDGRMESEPATYDTSDDEINRFLMACSSETGLCYTGDPKKKFHQIFSDARSFGDFKEDVRTTVTDFVTKLKFLGMDNLQEMKYILEEKAIEISGRSGFDDMLRDVFIGLSENEEKKNKK